MAKRIKWDKSALHNFNAAIKFIRTDSDKNAEKVRKDLLLNIETLKSNPLKYPADKYKNNNDGSFRAFELHHYRVSYMIDTTEVIIARVRHTSMEPLEY